MSRRLVYWLLVGLLLTAVLGLAAYAQTDTVPDAAVRGMGVVKFGTTNPGAAQFSINVAMAGGTLYGGFKWAEYAPTATVQPNVIVTRQVISIKFLAANHAVIQAVGYWNNLPANITLEALDDLAGDWLHITATNIIPPGSMMPQMIYDRAGGVASGDVVVYRKPVVTSYAKGYGAIKVKDNIGQFNFSAQASAVGTVGSISYSEFNPLVMSAISSPMIRPLVTILVRNVTSLTVDGKTAVLRGMGTLNGIPAAVTVKVADNYTPGTQTYAAAYDYFSIQASPITLSPVAIGYYAEGPLFRGDIVVGNVYTINQ